MKKGIKIFLIIASIILLFIVVYYVRFMRLDVYTYNESTRIIQKDSVKYVASQSLPSSFLDKKEKTIGKIKDANFWAAKQLVVKIKGIDDKEMFLVTGMMSEELFVREDKIEDFKKTLP